MSLVALDASFPNPSEPARRNAAAKLSAIADDERALIDGLALGVLPELAQAEHERLRLIGLVHHPLADETGLTRAQRDALCDSERAALAAMRQVVVTSAATARRLVEMGIDATRVAVIEPGTDPAPLAARAGQAPLQLLCVGALTPRKGHSVLLEALATLCDLPWRMQLIGSLERDPPTSTQVQAQIDRLNLSERVVLSGEVDEPALEQAYRQTDLFVLPSLFEGYGMAFTEALAHGLPIVGCATGAVPDTVPADAGLLVAPGSSAALAAALRWLLSDPGERRRLAAGAERARARLPDWPSQCRQWVQLLEQV